VDETRKDMKHVTQILKRHPSNPVISPKDHPGMCKIYNPSPAMYNGETILLLSILHSHRGPDNGETRVARSKDGIHFTIADEPFIKLNTKKYPFNIIDRHVIDNRTTQIGDTYYIMTPIMTDRFDAPATILGKTKDFKKYELMEVVTQPKNRGASLFPEKINGKYYKLDRPGGGQGQYCTIWLSSSPDLIHWGCFRPILRPGYSFWNPIKIGPTPPIKTKKGWLVIMHGVQIPSGGTYYYIGAILLDLKDPTKILGKTRSFLLGAEAEYERKGTCDNVVFPCGAIGDYEKDELRLYYGAADTCICLATGSLSEVVEACVKEL